MTRQHLLALVFGIGAAWVPCLLAQSQPPLKFGQSAPLTGPTAQLGLRVRAGIAAAVHEVNASGGIAGRRIELVSLDDGYEPARTAVNMRQLIDEQGVVAVLGSVGAPCAITAVPIAQEKKTLLYGYFTGGSVLRKAPADHYVVNFRAGLTEEVSELIEQFLQAGVRVDEIAFFTQQDAYGETAFAGGMAALQRHGLKATADVKHVRYERNTVNVESGLSELLLMQPEPKAVIFAGSGAPTVAFVREAHKADFRPLVGAFSFVDALYVAKELGADADGMVVTQVVPPLSSSAPCIDTYVKAMQVSAPAESPSFAAFEAYLSAHALFDALRRQPGDLSRQAVVKAIRGIGQSDIGMGKDRPVRLRQDGHTIAGYIWPTEIRGGEIRSLLPTQPSPLQGAR